MTAAETKNRVTTNYRAWATRGVAEWGIQDVRAALAALDGGNFARAALLADAIYTDDRVGAVLDVRIKGLTGLKREFLPGSGDARRSGAVVKTVQAHDDAAHFGGLPEHRRWIRYGLLVGACFGQLIWDTTTYPGEWVPRLEAWHPANFRYDQFEDVWYVQTRTGQVTVTPNDGKWALFSLSDTAPYMEGLIKRLAIPWLIRQYAYRDWARWSEVHGLPIRLAQVPSAAAEEDRDKFFNSLANLGNETVIEIPELSNEQGKFDVKLLEAAGRSWEGFKALLDKCDASIAISVLGQNLTTEVKGGSLAASKVHEEVKQDILDDDAKLYEAAFERGIMAPYALYNLGNENLAPQLDIHTEPPEDSKTDADTISSLGTGLQALTTAGYKMDPKELSEKFGFKITAAEVPATPAPGADGTPAPSAGLPAADSSQNGQEGGSKTPPGLQATKTTGSPARAEPAVALASGGSAPQGSGFVQGQLYVDALADSGTAEAAKTVDLAALASVIQAADSYEALRADLLTLYAGMTPDAFQSVMEKALVLAQLAGRKAVLQDL